MTLDISDWNRRIEGYQHHMIFGIGEEQEDPNDPGFRDMTS